MVDRRTPEKPGWVGSACEGKAVSHGIVNVNGSVGPSVPCGLCWYCTWVHGLE